MNVYTHTHTYIYTYYIYMYTYMHLSLSISLSLSFSLSLSLNLSHPHPGMLHIPSLYPLNLGEASSGNLVERVVRQLKHCPCRLLLKVGCCLRPGRVATSFVQKFKGFNRKSFDCSSMPSSSCLPFRAPLPSPTALSRYAQTLEATPAAEAGADTGGTGRDQPLWSQGFSTSNYALHPGRGGGGSWNPRKHPCPPKLSGWPNRFSDVRRSLGRSSGDGNWALEYYTLILFCSGFLFYIYLENIVLYFRLKAVC